MSASSPHLFVSFTAGQPNELTVLAMRRFTEIVKVKSICVIGPRDGEAPNELRV